MTQQKGCPIHSIVIMNMLKNSLPLSDFDKIVKHIADCLKGKISVSGGAVLKGDVCSFDIEAGDIPKLLECKNNYLSSLLKGKYGKDKEVRQNPIDPFPSGSPFTNKCPPTGSFVVLITRRPLAVGITHLVACQVVECDPKTGKATLKCYENPGQGGGQGEDILKPDYDATTDAEGRIKSNSVNINGHFAHSYIA